MSKIKDSLRGKSHRSVDFYIDAGDCTTWIQSVFFLAKTKYFFCRAATVVILVSNMLLLVNRNNVVSLLYHAALSLFLLSGSFFLQKLCYFLLSDPDTVAVANIVNYAFIGQRCYDSISCRYVFFSSQATRGICN